MRRAAAAVVEWLSSFGHDNNPAGAMSGDMRAASHGRLALIALLALTLGACTLPSPGVVKATPSTTGLAIASPTPPGITPPTNLVRPGTITFLSDTTYPPQEWTDVSTQQAVGFDIEIAQAIAAKMGVTATIQKTDSP